MNEKLLICVKTLVQKYNKPISILVNNMAMEPERFKVTHPT